MRTKYQNPMQHNDWAECTKPKPTKRTFRIPYQNQQPLSPHQSDHTFLSMKKILVKAALFVNHQFPLYPSLNCCNTEMQSE